MSSGPDSLTAPLAEALRDPHPLAFLEYASMLAHVTEPDPLADVRHLAGGHNPPRRSIDRDDLIDSFFEVGMRETDALLMVWAEMLGDDALRDRAHRELPRRRHSMPEWLRRLDQVRPTRIIEGSHLLGDGENLFIGVETAGRSFTIVLYIDHNMGTIPKDGFAIDHPIGEIVGRMHEDSDDDIVTDELLLEDGGAKIAEAFENESHLLDPFENDTWPGVRPLARWMLRLMPAGGTGYAKVEPTDAELDAIVESFLTSPFATDGASDLADQVRTLLHFGPYYSGSDPLRWSPVVAEMVLMDLIPRKVMADPAYLRGIPDAMRALVRFAHAERSVPTRYTDQTLAAIDEFEPQYLGLIAAERRPGTLGMVQQMLTEGDDRFGLNELFDDDISTDEYFLRRLALRTGGMPALDDLDVVPLPDEPLVLPPLTRSAAAKIDEVAEIVDRACTEYFADAELRTAARRLITRIAETDADVLTRGKSANAASAVCWIIAQVNDAFESFTVNGLTESLGVKTSPQDRAQTMLTALGVDYFREWEFDHALGDTDLLTSRTRAALIARRDRLRAAIAETNTL